MQQSCCGLCLDPIAESSLSIDNPDLRSKMNKLFYFTIATTRGNSSHNVCQTCSQTIAEFYDYTEKVRENQQRLLGSVMIEAIKVEPAELEEPIVEDQVEVKVELAESDRDESPPPVKKRRVRRPLNKDTEKPKTDKANLVNIKSKEQLAEEDEKLNEFYQMKCDVCGASAENFTELKSHFRSNHGCNGYIVCCKKKLLKRIYLLEHLEFHLNPTAFKCELCNKNYKNKFYLSVHQLKVHGTEEDRPFKCDQCPQAFVKTYQLRAHLETHEKVECPTCHRTMANKIALRVHMTNAHSAIDRRMICEACGQEFISKPAFERHVKEHAGIEVVKREQCPICQKWLRYLNSHIEFVHGNREQGQVMCEICQQSYPNSKALASHKRAVHVTERYECEFCGKKFKNQVNLKEHRTQHTGERLYACEHCDATMNSKANMYVHVKKQHPMEWAEKKEKAQ